MLTRETVIKLHAQGMSYKQIGQMYGRTKQRAYQIGNPQKFERIYATSAYCTEHAQQIQADKAITPTLSKCDWRGCRKPATCIAWKRVHK